MLVAGVDLAVRRPSALALYDGANAFVKYCENETLIHLLKALRPSLVAIDAPLSVPNGPWRKVDLKAKRMGLKVLPPGWKGMRRLAETGKRLKEELEGSGIRTLETFPASVRRLWRVPLEGDLRDALLCAMTAYRCLKGLCYCVKEDDGEICIPKEVIYSKT